jgi:Flp pilus assembly protein TadD
LIEAGNAASAVAIATQAINTAPKSMAVKLLYARAQEAASNFPDVITTYRQMTDSPEFLKITPRQQAGYRLLLASALDKNGDWPGAKSELEKLLVVDPNNAQALNYLGYLMLERGGDRMRATAMVKQAYDIEPKSSAITDSLGWAYYLQGDAARALPLLESAAKDAGTDIAINEHLGDIYWAVGRRRDARYAWRVASHGAEGEAAARLAQKIDTGPLLPKS